MRFVAVLALVAACGDGMPAPDANVVIDTPPGLVTVVVNYGTFGRVFFQNADGSLVLATHLDENGEANAYMAPGGFVTLVAYDSSSYFARTWAGVQPGDRLTFGSIVLEQDPLAIFFSWPVDPGAFQYVLSTTCGTSFIQEGIPQPLSIELEDCQRQRRAAMLLRSQHPDHVDYVFARDVPVDQGAHVMMTGPYTPTETLVLRGTNISSDVRQLVPRAALFVGERQLASTDDFTGDILTPIASTVQIAKPLPLPASATLLVELEAFAGSALSVPQMIAWGPARADMTLDFDAHRLRQLATRPVFVPVEHAVRWTEQSTGHAPDAVLAMITWRRGFFGAQVRWEILAPHTGSPVVKLPVLPMSELAFKDGDSFLQTEGFALLGVDGGYDRLRSQVLGRWSFGLGQRWPLDGESGFVAAEGLPR